MIGILIIIFFTLFYFIYNVYYITSTYCLIQLFSLEIIRKCIMIYDIIVHRTALFKRDVFEK